ncbi:MAG: 50S ribosomal protein L3 [Candidatus Moranbacteria bacterium CG23_combo_of_CG06-09_8_20_14_all_39_10]|nr:MAG: 50S ribosomal protein L3 [Candidatus Moranbacteria bacterium CG23_combo_of_CG06-09_8_20_14_all_39_10]
MTKFILGKKLGMTTIFSETNEALNVTLVECAAKVSALRTEEKDGHVAVQIEMPKTKKRIVKKEFRVASTEAKVGDEISVDIFEIGDEVHVTGIAKAKGFQGVVKRHSFSGGYASHGNKHALRAPGAIGSGYPEHVIKGKRMAGRMGGKRVTSKNVKIVFINKEQNLMALKGAVPGIPGAVVEIYTTN